MLMLNGSENDFQMRLNGRNLQEEPMHVYGHGETLLI